MSSVRREMARALALLFFTGGAFAAVALVLPHPSGSYETGIGIVSLAAFAGAGILLVVPSSELPIAVFHAFLAAGTALISLAIYWWRPGEIASSVAMIYVWVLLYAFYYFDLPAAAVHTVLVAASFGAVLAVQPGHEAAGTHWIVTVGTAGVAGVLIGRLSRRVGASAALDGLTGIANRRRFEQALDDELNRCARSGRSVAVAIIDLDCFKELNDAGGHEAGDRALVTLAGTWKQQTRKSDLLARYGGDEFALLMRDCDARGAEEGVRRLVQAAPAYPCTVGIACWDRAEDPQGIVSRADSALYKGKSGGRNQIVVAD
ncbi:MAG TPA: GGDEF domain-containing protein [Acidimicrobiales bacterium]|nr:GGDEF domain-containing protein [Acidimicrobiales bacterium]